jgi:hypothetical protein
MSRSRASGGERTTGVDDRQRAAFARAGYGATGAGDDRRRDASGGDGGAAGAGFAMDPAEVSEKTGYRVTAATVAAVGG